MRPGPLAGSVAALVAGAVGAVALGLAQTAADEPSAPWVIAPGDEAAGAVAEGAATIARAQQLAKRKRYAEALPLFEEAARRWPAAEHDCYLALAYLRVDDVTRAQLWHEVSRRRNAARPTWCTGSLTKQLDAAVRAGGLVPLTLQIVPPDAVIEVAGVTLRGLDVVWLAPGTHVVAARADGMVDGSASIDVAAPSATVTLTLAPPPPPEPDAGPLGVEAPDAAAVATAPGPDAAPLGAPAVSPPPAARPPRWPGYVALGAGAVALGVAGFSHAQALDARDAANAEFPTTTAFADAEGEFAAARLRALGGYAVAAAAIGFGAYWLVTRDGDEAAAGATRVGATLEPGGASVTLGWTFEEVGP